MVMVYCEGQTEWHVIRKLHEYNVLNGDQIFKINDADVHIINSPKRITKNFILNSPRSWSGFLLVYDREGYTSPIDFVNNEFSHLSPWNQVNHNIFCTRCNNRLVYLHVNDSSSPNGNGDFDGYLVKLITTIGPQLAQLIFDNALPAYIRGSVTTSNNIPSAIHQIGTQDIPDLMKRNAFPIQRSKGQLYAYITASQLSKSHVWFAEKIINLVLENGLTHYVENVFDTLIDAWDRLIGGQCP